MSIAPTTPPAQWSPLWRMSVPQYDQLVASDVLTEEDPIELLQGCLVKKMPRTPAHDTAVTLAQQALEPLLPDGWYIRIQAAIETDDSKPEPDLAVVRAPVDRYARQHPRGRDLALVVEAAETSLARDRNKATIYATEGVPEYWIVNLVGREVDCYTQPDPSRGGYQHQRVYSRPGTIPLTVDGADVGTIATDDLFPSNP